MATDWQMPRRSDRCCVSGKVFEVGETFWVVLRETPEGYLRDDYAVEHVPEAALEDEIARWRTRRPEPEHKRPVTLDRQNLYDIFRKLEPENEQQRQFRFVLALLLWRKKVLKLADTEHDDEGRELWVFDVVGEADDVYRVARPELDEDQAESLGQQLETLLIGGVLTDPSAEPAASEAETAEPAPQEEPAGEPE